MIFEEVKKFYNRYGGKKCIIGYSFRGREIFAFHIGSPTGRQFIATYAIHGREWITARLALKHIKTGLSAGGGWVIPLVNPDGATICEELRPMWKANARGVDLNCNFDAEWGSGRLNVKMRGSENCMGDKPFSEAETIALRDFTLKVRPYVTFSFHTKGEEIYTAKVICGSAGGYKDWCIQKLHIPSYTVECGSDDNVHPIKKLRKVKKCFKALKIFTEKYG